MSIRLSHQRVPCGQGAYYWRKATIEWGDWELVAVVVMFSSSDDEYEKVIVAFRALRGALADQPSRPVPLTEYVDAPLSEAVALLLAEGGTRIPRSDEENRFLLAEWGFLDSVRPQAAVVG